MVPRFRDKTGYNVWGRIVQGLNIQGCIIPVPLATCSPDRLITWPPGHLATLPHDHLATWPLGYWLQYMS
jgi:hypothetical protein